MATILKAPSINDSSKGVIIFTTQERDEFILGNNKILSKINKLKSDWFVGLHHNWHDHKFEYNPIFDFSLAGEGDLIEINDKKFNQIYLDACNFSPEFFKISNNEKNWDILYVARAVFFKNIPDFFNIIRKLYDNKKYFRVLLICPIPVDCKNIVKNQNSYCKIRDDYNKLFSDEEKSFFTLLTTDFNDPFPFDLKTLSFFYNASKIFVHSAENERRCRVIGYAHASGMPVVCLDNPASLIPKNIQSEPIIYIAKDYSEFPILIEKAIKHYDSEDFKSDKIMPGVYECSSKYNKKRLKEILDEYLGIATCIEEYNFNDLDIRLGRHHGFGNHRNSCGWKLDTLINYLENQPKEQINFDIKMRDVEKYILKYSHYGSIQEKKVWSLNKKYIKSILANYFPNIVRLVKLFSK